MTTKTLVIDVRETTWPRAATAAGAVAVPSAFAPYTPKAATDTLAIEPMLLYLGYLTTPHGAVGVSLSEWWAWVRYLYAISPAPDLRITDDFANLDAHQKTILSDDFGMGVTMWWLARKLDLGDPIDGRYFIEKYNSSHGIGATTPTSNNKGTSKALKKKGPTKAPDFVCQDSAGMWHVVECKGTQSGDAYRKRQMDQKPKGKPATGAVVQKRVITFPKAIAGQRLACGLTIESHGSAEVSELQIRDPDGPALVRVNDDDLPLITEIAFRERLGRILRSAGMFASADIIREPAKFVHSRKSPQADSRPESKRRTLGEALRIDIEPLLPRAATDEFIGRSAIFDIPGAAKLNGFRRIKVQQMISVELLETLLKAIPASRGNDRDELAIAMAAVPQTFAHDFQVQAGEAMSVLQMGKAYRSTLQFD